MCSPFLMKKYVMGYPAHQVVALSRKKFQTISLHFSAQILAIRSVTRADFCTSEENILKIQFMPFRYAQERFLRKHLECTVPLEGLTAKLIDCVCDC